MHLDRPLRSVQAWALDPICSHVAHMNRRYQPPMKSPGATLMKGNAN